MKKKIIIIAAVLMAIGVAVFGYWTIAPIFINKEVSESEPIAEQATKPMIATATGKFTGITYHEAEGTAKVLESGGKKFIRFEDDFKVTNGPDLFVYLGKNGKYDPAANLGALKGNIGSQNYEIPESIDSDEYDSVWVWCRAFSVGFGVAELK
ncbi:MAG: DM13 domain-containing protein [Patescibacteria group bacterium]